VWFALVWFDRVLPSLLLSCRLCLVFVSSLSLLYLFSVLNVVMSCTVFPGLAFVVSCPVVPFESRIFVSVPLRYRTLSNHTRLAWNAGEFSRARSLVCLARLAFLLPPGAEFASLATRTWLAL
jgi:hypothetical protein